MEARASDAGAECRGMEEEPDENPVVFLDEDKLLEVISEGSLKFEEWTSLLSLTEKTYPDDMEKISLVYNAFLAEYPLCYVYWRKYVNHTIKLCAPEKAVEVFERAVESAMYCVDVWVDYCTFGCVAFGDASDARRLFKRALSFVGKDYLCHTLWDKYIEFEFSQQQWSFLADIYIQALRFPTKKLHHYYDSFKKLVGVLKDEMGVQSEPNLEEPVEPVLTGELSTSYKLDKVTGIIRDLLDPSSASAGFKALQEYLAIGETFYRNSCRLNEKISCFEAHINRSYFHVKPLEVSQLENWLEYLDFAESHGDFDWAFKLYERCLIPCANYPEVWVRYVEFMESKGGRELADFALSRATKTFVKRISVMHLCNAWFKEHLGDVSNARAAFLNCNVESDSDFVESVIRKANMEKRLGNFKAAARTCKQALKVAVTMGKHDVLPLLYIHFSRLKMITDGEDAAVDILTDAIKRIPSSKLLIEELINFAMSHSGSRHIAAVKSIVVDALSLSSSSSKGLSTEDGEEISRLYLEFVDLCGNINDVRKAWTRHVRLFPRLLRTPPLQVANGRQWKMSTSQIHEKDKNVQSSSPDNKPLSLENQNTQDTSDRELVPEHKSPQQMNPELVIDNNAALTNESINLLQSGASDAMQEEVPMEIEDEVPEQNLSVDLVDQGSSKTQSAEVPPQFSKEMPEKREDPRDLPEEVLNPLQLDKLSLEPQQSQSPGGLIHDPEVPKSSSSVLTTPDDGQVSEENNSQNEIMPVARESGEDRDPVSTNPTVPVHIDGWNRSPPFSAGDHNMSNRGRNWHQRNKTERRRGDFRPGYHDRSQERMNRRGPPHRLYTEAEAVHPSFSKPQGDPSENPPDQQQGIRFLTSGHQTQAQQIPFIPGQQGYPSENHPDQQQGIQFPTSGHQTQAQQIPFIPGQQGNPSENPPDLQQVIQFPTSGHQTQAQQIPFVPGQQEVAQQPLETHAQQENVQYNNMWAYEQMLQYYYYYQQQLAWVQQQLQEPQNQEPQQQMYLQQQYQQQLLQLQYLYQQLLLAQPQQNLRPTQQLQLQQYHYQYQVQQQPYDPQQFQQQNQIYSYYQQPQIQMLDHQLHGGQQPGAVSSQQHQEQGQAQMPSTSSQSQTQLVPQSLSMPDQGAVTAASVNPSPTSPNSQLQSPPQGPQ